jgi:hypothetical protein
MIAALVLVCVGLPLAAIVLDVWLAVWRALTAPRMGKRQRAALEAFRAAEAVEAAQLAALRAGYAKYAAEMEAKQQAHWFAGQRPPP